MADDMYQYSPGILTNILARQKAEARQAMLDEFERKKFESNEEIKRDTLATNKVLRDAQAEAATASAVQRKLSGFSMGDEPTPEDYEWFKSHGGASYFTPPTQSSVTTEEGGQFQPSIGLDDAGNPGEDFYQPGEKVTSTEKVPARFKGSTDERSDLRDQLMFSAMAQDASLPQEVRNFARIRAASPKATVPTEIFKSHQGGSQIVYDQATGKITRIPIGENDHFSMESRPPQAPAPVFNFIGMGADGQPIFAGNRAGKDGKPPVVAGEVPGGKLGPKPSNSTARQARVPASVIQNYAKALEKATPIPTLVDKAMGRPGKPNEAAVTQAEALKQSIINFASTPGVKSIVRDALEPELADAQESSDEIVAALGSQLTPAEQQEAVDILYQIRLK